MKGSDITLNTISERIKFIRKDLKLTQEAFGEKLGVSRDVINNLERDRVDIKEPMKKLICRIFNVDYFWLTEGTGEPYIGVPDLILEEAIEKYNLDDTDKKLIEEYIKLEPAVRDAIKAYLSNVFSK